MQLVPDGDANRRAGSKRIPRLLPPRNMPLSFRRGRIIVVDFFLRDLSGDSILSILSLFFLPDAQDASFRMLRLLRNGILQNKIYTQFQFHSFFFFFFFNREKMRRFLLDKILRVEFRGSLVFHNVRSNFFLFDAGLESR